MRGKRVVVVMSVLLLIAILQTLPVFLVKPVGALVLKGENVIVYYQGTDEKGAQKVFNVLENTAEEVRKKLGIAEDKLTEVYVYGRQDSLWIRKFGFITLLFAPEWYIGDNKGEKVLLVSPYAKVKGHDFNSILDAATHELVHTYNYRVNPKLSYWIDNGVATFISRQLPREGLTDEIPVPAFSDLKTENEKKFGNIGGYEYSYTYIEFINSEFGWDKVLELVRGKKTYQQIFEKSEQEIYDQWVKFLHSNY